MADQMITVRQTGSPIRRPEVQEQTLRGLGLGRIGRTRTLKATLPVLGMVVKVAHMIEARDGGPDGVVIDREEVQRRMAALRAKAK